MTIDLVSRSARALSDHLNKMYRVLKGIDPDSLSLRLSSGGGFEVRHSVTNAVLFRVTDTGLVLPAASITTAMIADGTITSADIADDAITNVDVNPNAAIGLAKLAHVGAGNVLKSNGTVNVAGKIVSADIQDGTIVGADIQDASIPSTKLTGLSGVPAGAITTAEIADGTIQTVDIAPNAITTFYRAAINTSVPSTSGLIDVPGAGLFPVAPISGELFEIGFNGTIACSLVNAVMSLLYVIGGVTILNLTYNAPSAGSAISVSFKEIVTVAAVGSGQHKMQFSTNVGTLSLVGRMTVMHYRK